MIDDEDDDEEMISPLRFKEVLGEHTLSGEVRMALIWASVVRFLTEEEREEIPPEDFTERERQLAKSTVFHGPFEDFEEAKRESLRRRGVVVAYLPSWSEERQPCWLVCLAH